MDKFFVEEMLYSYTEGSNMLPSAWVVKFLQRKGFDLVEQSKEAGQYGEYFYFTLRKSNILVSVSGSRAWGETELETCYWEVEEV